MAEIKKYQENDVEAFVRLCKNAFPKHNVFDTSLKSIKEYLKRKDAENIDLGGVFFAYEGPNVVGGALLRIEQQDLSNTHVRYKYNHLVAKNDKIKSELLKFLDNKIKKDIATGKIKTAKIEVGLAENESDLGFYVKQGFKIEGELASHYRHGEKVQILGKEIM